MFGFNNHLLIGLILIIGLAGCATPRGTGSTLQTGEASWYGPGFHGQQTANGEIYDQNELTAAHRTLPFDTIVEVRNMENGESVRVRINDRGPYAGNRVIDLSKRAAKEIDMVDSGVAQVRLILVRAGGEIRTAGGDFNQEIYTVQVASFSSPGDAEKIVDDIGRGARVERGVANGQTVYRVYYGNFTSRSRAERAQRRLARNGYNGFVRQAQN